MFKIISKDKFEEIKQENLLLKIRLHNVVSSYNNYSYNQLSKIRKHMIEDLRIVDEKIKAIDLAIKRTHKR